MGPIYCVMPPYQEVSEISLRRVPTVERGGVIIIDVSSQGRIDYERFRRLIHALRRRSNATVAIRLSSGTATAALYNATYAYRCGVRAVLVSGEPLRPTLWKWLTDPVGIPEDLISWLRLRRPVSDNLARMIVKIVRDAPRYSDFADLLDHLDVRGRTLRRRMELESLPAPSKWYHLGRLLHAQFRLLRDPLLDTTRLAYELGYADRMSFTNRIYRLFGVTAETSRRLLGWEWRFAAWWKRVYGGVNPSRQKSAVTDFDVDSISVHPSVRPN